MNPVLAPYPWELLPRASRRAVREARRVRARLDDCVSLEALEGALTGVLSCHVMIVVRSIAPSESWPGDEAGVHLVSADRAVALVVEPEPALASFLLSRVLGRNPALFRIDAPLDPGTRGALAAIAVEVARSARARIPFRSAIGSGSAGPGVRVEATLFLDEKPYAVSVRARDEAAPTTGHARPVDLASLGDLPIELRLVAAESLGSRAEISALREGDVWLPGKPPWASPGAAAGADPAVLCLAAPNAERGTLVHRSGADRIVLRGDVVALSLEASPAAEQAATVHPMSASHDTLERMVIDAPVVVRVEVGSVTLPAREWAELRPGDVIETGLRLAEPVVLRVAGREVARGELVTVDGELGVRIREILDASRSP